MRLLERKKSKVAFTQQLSSVPVKNHRMEELERDDGCVILRLQLAYPRWMLPLKALLNLHDAKRVRLDRVGTGVLDRIDGHKTFEQLIDEFAADHALTFFEARALLMQYLRTLMGKGIVVIALPDK